MPKMKTHKAGAKRYKVTGSGKILRRQAGRKHLLGHKATARKNRLGGFADVSETNLEKIKLELPYMKYSR
ncbi:MAG: 50S ribosomal protein L35 [Candidatus Melainabacteria bacterium GWA2_34_9]|nr:MAG: 50S ribosomal protein L35 [Candidatus Melainabacteria bacterium GWA2_34_9]